MFIGNQNIDENDLKLALGKRIRALREAKSYSQVFVADTIGMSPKYYSEIELGRRNPSLINIVKIARAFSVTLDELILVNTGRHENKLKAELCESVEHFQNALNSLKKIVERV